jgi:hypothetical protein
MLNFCGIVVAILKMETGRNILMVFDIIDILKEIITYFINFFPMKSLPIPMSPHGQGYSL